MPQKLEGGKSEQLWLLIFDSILVHNCEPRKKQED